MYKMAPPFRRYSSTLFILFLSLQWFVYNSLAVEPTVIKGSTYVLPSGSFTGALTDVNLSGLFDDTPTLTYNNNIPATSTSNPSPTIASTTITNSPVIETAPVSSPPSEKQVAKTNDDNDQPMLSTGVIVGIVVGGIVAIMLTVLLCVFMIRRKKNKKFDRGRGITPSMVISMRTKTPSLLDPMKTTGHEMGFHQKPVQMYYPERSNMMMTQPSESITEAIDKMYNVKQYNTRSAAFSSTATIPHTPNSLAPTTRDSTVNNNSNPRLSKYSYLAQAFTQMRESYAAHSSLSPPPPESPSSTPMPSSGHHVTSSHHTKNNTTDTTYLRAPDNMDDMDDDDNNNNHHNNYYPTTTATATPYHPTSLTPTPPRIAIFNENSEQVDNSYHSPDVHNDRNFQESNNSTLVSSSLSTNPNRDSVTSDVSQYSTFSNPFRYPSPDNARTINNNNNNNNQTTSMMMTDSRMPTPPRPSPSHQQFRSPKKQYNYI
ncbi:hypothetical protein BDC45DRAFT_560371 [Circinella umbellata]|nr:hypothetical protein BDC45DRAFT_560371 [Circinella umbellata]